MNENAKYIVGAVAVVGLSIGAVLYLGRQDREAPPADPVAAAPQVPAADPEPAVKHPLPESNTDEALPSLDDSDAVIKGAIAGLIGKDPAEQVLVPEQLVRHIVVTVDNLTEQKLAERIRPVKSVPGALAVSGTDEAPVLDAANYARYDSFVQMLRATDTQVLVASYQRYYPLFQEAYENLGHPPQYFNDRVIEVIDHLLAAPEIREPIALTQPGVLYEYADPKLESLSSGQKALVRMGADHAAVVKTKLRELRSALVARPAG